MKQDSMKTIMKRCRKQSEFEQVSRKKKSVDCFFLLPDDLLLEIFQKLPSDILRYKTKFVCKRWFNIITDKILFDHASLILEGPTGSDTLRLMDISEEKQGLKVKYKYIDISYNGHIKSWCNEFLLITDLKKEGSLYIFNLITKEGSFLPKCSTSCGGHYGCKCSMGLSYDKFKGVYKVVHVFRGPQIQCELLILKCNGRSFDPSKWKKVNGPYYVGQRKYYWDDAVSVQGRYLHWDVHCNKYLVSMDTVKERFRQTRLPASPDILKNDQKCYFVEIGGFLSLLYKVSVNKYDMWMLKDYQRPNWEKMQSVIIENYVLGSRVYSCRVLPFPLTGVKCKRYLIFRNSLSEVGLYSYDLKRKIMIRLDIEIAGGERCVVQSTAASL